jgi:hypothetical protein
MTVQGSPAPGDISGGRVPRRSNPSVMSTASRRARALLSSFQQFLVDPPADVGRARSAKPERGSSLVKYDCDVLHIIQQYPGCNQAHILAFLRARVHWFGRGTMIDKLLRPSLGAVQAAVRRLEIAGKIKSYVQPLHNGPLLRFYPNNPIWPGSENA